MRNTKRFTSLAAIAVLGLMAAACGSDGTHRRHRRTCAATRHHGAAAGTTHRSDHAPDHAAPPAPSKAGVAFDTVAVATVRSTTRPAAGIDKAVERTRRHEDRGSTQRRRIEPQGTARPRCCSRRPTSSSPSASCSATRCCRSRPRRTPTPRSPSSTPPCSIHDCPDGAIR